MDIAVGHVEPCLKRIRAVRDGAVVLDTTSATYVWHHPHYPQWRFPADDVKTGALADGTWRDAGDGMVDIDWSGADQWFEEDEEVFIHPRSPYARIDILQSTRRVRVAIKGVTVAETDQPRILFETGLPPRYYVPLTALRFDLLRPSSTRTGCPYKGFASYWSVEIDGEVFEDIVWTYKTPLPESQKIAGYACFYNDRVELTVE